MRQPRQSSFFFLLCPRRDAQIELLSDQRTTLNTEIVPQETRLCQYINIWIRRPRRHESLGVNAVPELVLGYTAPKWAAFVHFQEESAWLSLGGISSVLVNTKNSVKFNVDLNGSL